MSIILSMQQKSLTQKHPILPLHLCCNFADYEILITLISQDENNLKEICKEYFYIMGGGLNEN